ncbi:putative protein FAM10A4 [Bombus pyrosoma]|uniref:putative protein FAM10A4 n=1 Tax=Bombus pyrosoma TaxID=396416 RepID=UPI001CB9CF7F|nr:putative protein FAM10A4 [Bombus pyrosoma]
MSFPITPEFITQLGSVVNSCILNPSLLYQPDYSFLKSLIEFYGGRIPEINQKSSNESPSKKPEDANASEEPEPEPEPESDIDLDMSGVIEPDEDTPQKMGNPTLQPTEEEIAESQAKRSEAVSAFIEKDYEKAIELYTEAIVLNPQASLLYAKRGQIFMLINKPNACIRDCNRALELNPDSAAAHKFRGRAYHLLGKFEEAATDLRLACKFDFDEQADEWLREVTPNARKIEEHKRKKERKIQEKLERERQERLRKARESAKAYEDNTRTSQTDHSGNTPGIGNFYQFLNDPDVLKAFQDPEIAEAFRDISSNPTNILKYQSSAKVMMFVNKMAAKFAGPSNMPDAFHGLMGGIPGFAMPRTSKPKPQDDVGLD